MSLLILHCFTRENTKGVGRPKIQKMGQMGQPITPQNGRGVGGKSPKIGPGPKMHPGRTLLAQKMIRKKVDFLVVLGPFWGPPTAAGVVSVVGCS